MNILQVGYGGFGTFHTAAWLQLGFRGQLMVAERIAQRRRAAIAAGIPESQVVDEAAAVLPQVDIVDIVTPTEQHFPLCEQALKAGKDVFVEKPMTLTAEEARKVAQLVQEHDRILQVGYSYRVHPISQEIKRRLALGELGRLRYVAGHFYGVKRARTDVGVTHTDGIHFLDLLNWLLEESPVEVYAAMRDHFGRGLEDLSIVLATYPTGTLMKIESGYLQPGRWEDRVVPNATTTKELILCGERATLEADFETGRLRISNVQHEFRDGTWHPRWEGKHEQEFQALGPSEQVALELRAFLECVRERRQPEADVQRSGVELAILIEAIYESDSRREPIRLEAGATTR